LGRVEIGSVPKGAVVRLDGEERGKTPLEINELKPGNYSVEISTPGYVPFRQSIVVAHGAKFHQINERLELRKVVVACLGDSAVDAGLVIAKKLRVNGLPSVIAPRTRSLKSQMRYASNIEARFTIIIGENELASETVLLRNMDNGEQTEAPIIDVVNIVSSKAGF